MRICKPNFKKLFGYYKILNSFALIKNYQK